MAFNAIPTLQSRKLFKADTFEDLATVPLMLQQEENNRIKAVNDLALSIKKLPGEQGIEAAKLENEFNKLISDKASALATKGISIDDISEISSLANRYKKLTGEGGDAYMLNKIYDDAYRFKDELLKNKDLTGYGQPLLEKHFQGVLNNYKLRNEDGSINPFMGNQLPNFLDVNAYTADKFRATGFVETISKTLGSLEGVTDPVEFERRAKNNLSAITSANAFVKEGMNTEEALMSIALQHNLFDENGKMKREETIAQRDKIVDEYTRAQFQSFLSNDFNIRKPAKEDGSGNTQEAKRGFTSQSGATKLNATQKTISELESLVNDPNTPQSAKAIAISRLNLLQGVEDKVEDFKSNLEGKERVSYDINQKASNFINKFQDSNSANFNKENVKEDLKLLYKELEANGLIPDEKTGDDIYSDIITDRHDNKIRAYNKIKKLTEPVADKIDKQVSQFFEDAVATHTLKRPSTVAHRELVDKEFTNFVKAQFDLDPNLSSYAVNALNEKGEKQFLNEDEGDRKSVIDQLKQNNNLVFTSINEATGEVSFEYKDASDKIQKASIIPTNPEYVERMFDSIFGLVTEKGEPIMFPTISGKGISVDSFDDRTALSQNIRINTTRNAHSFQNSVNPFGKNLLIPENQQKLNFKGKPFFEKSRFVSVAANNQGEPYQVFVSEDPSGNNARPLTMGEVIGETVSNNNSEINIKQAYAVNKYITSSLNRNLIENKNLSESDKKDTLNLITSLNTLLKENKLAEYKEILANMKGSSLTFYFDDYREAHSLLFR